MHPSDFSSARYLFRIDDVCPTMKPDSFAALCRIFDSYTIKPILGVIPDNRDPQLNLAAPNPHFWPTIRQRFREGWIIAQHGYQHRYQTTAGGLLNIQLKSEFAGLSYRQQYNAIASGQKILEEQIGGPVTWWMAPSHSFDQITCQVLVELKFEYITDGISIFPFRRFGLTWVPQQLWRPRSEPYGLWTICLHPNTMSADAIQQIERFIKNHYQACQSIDLKPRHSLLNPLFRFLWYGTLALKKI